MFPNRLATKNLKVGCGCPVDSNPNLCIHFESNNAILYRLVPVSYRLVPVSDEIAVDIVGDVYFFVLQNFT